MRPEKCLIRFEDHEVLYDISQSSFHELIGHKLEHYQLQDDRRCKVEKGCKNTLFMKHGSENKPK